MSDITTETEVTKEVETIKAEVAKLEAELSASGKLLLKNLPRQKLTRRHTLRA